MPFPDASNTVESVHRVKEEIDKLTEQQIEGLRRATYLGMTTDEAKEYDERRKKIVRLIQELTLLERAQ